MLRKGSKRVSFSPDVNDHQTIFLKRSSRSRVAGSMRRVSVVCSFRLLKGSGLRPPVRFLRRLGAKVARTLRLVSSMRRRRSSRKVSSTTTLARSRSMADPIDSYRAEAIEDCIEFLNSSSSSQRSNSVTSCSCSTF